MNPVNPSLRQGGMKVSAFVVTAILAPEHPDYLGPGQQVYCYLCFPALNDEDEGIAKVAELLKQAALRLHHIDQLSIFDRDDAVTGDPAIDVPREDIRTLGSHLRVSKTA